MTYDDDYFMIDDSFEPYDGERFVRYLGQTIADADPVELSPHGMRRELKVTCQNCYSLTANWSARCYRHMEDPRG
jgi:hypothetical protein